MTVNPASRMLSAISFGVLRRSAPSTSAIIRSRNDLPGSWVTSITSRSERSRVPPVTAERSPPASRMTGADSPVIADSSTEPTPSTISPSAGITSPASTTTRSPRASSGAGTSSIAPVAARRWAVVVVRVARRALACALPRPSAIASAKLSAGSRTVSQSQREMTPTNQSDAVWPRASSSTKMPVVMALPSSTMNMTWDSGAGPAAWVELRERAAHGAADDLGGEDAGGCPRHQWLPSRSSARFSSSTLTPGSPKKPSERPSVAPPISRSTVARERWRTAATRWA